MAVDANVALALRRDLARLARDHDPLVAALGEVRDAPNAAEARRLAFELGLRFPGVAGLGELASRQGEEREELLMAAADTGEARAAARALVEATLARGVFRALHGVFAASFRSPMLEAELRYRASLKELPKRTVWPGSPVTLGDVYVPPACTLYFPQDFETWGGAPEGEHFDDPLDALRFWLDEHPTENLALIGAHGSGKSTVGTMLAAALADDPTWLPVTLSNNSPATIQEEIIWSMTGASSPPRWFSMDLLPRLVVFDDRAAGSRRQTAPRLGVVVYTVASPELDGDEAPVLQLAPFDNARARLWVARWNERGSPPIDVERLLAAVPDDEVLSWRPTTSPFALLMLAQMQSAGRTVRGGAVLQDRAALYREMITWACDLAATDAAVVTEPAAAREKLRDLAERAQRRAVQRQSFRRFEGVELRPINPWWHASEGRPRFPLVVDRPGVNFFHESFAEYLIAERIAFECHRLGAFATDVDGETTLAADAEDLARRWLRVFGLAPLDESLEALLRVMIPTWQSFVRGKFRTPSEFASSWSRIVSTVFRVLAGDDSWRIAVDVADALGVKPSGVRAHALDALLRLGGLTGASTRTRLAPETIQAGSIAPLLGWLRTQGVRLAARSYEGAITLANASLQRADLVGVDLAGLDLSRADIRDGNLRGADLRRCSLTGTDLRRASLAGALVDGAVFDDALLIDASIAGCNLTDAQRSAAIWTREEGLARGIPQSVFDDDDIPF